MCCTDWSTTGREKQKRIREFRSSLVEQKSFIDAPSPQLHSVSENWTFAQHTFAGNVDEVRDAVPLLKRRAFNSAVEGISVITPKDVDEIAVNEQGERLLIGQKKLSDALGKLIELLK